MEFLLTKTVSDCDEEGHEIPPHKNARLKQCDRIEVRTIRSECEFDRIFGVKEGAWRSKGVDHTINTEGYIQRRHPLASKNFVIEIPTLEDLIAFIKENGEVVIQEGDAGMFEIEIYNGYRE